MTVTAADLDAVATQLGRTPRGVLDISYRCPDGAPGVVKTAPKLDDGTPFPTLYYLTDPPTYLRGIAVGGCARDEVDDRAPRNRC